MPTLVKGFCVALVLLLLVACESSPTLVSTATPASTVAVILPASTRVAVQPASPTSARQLAVDGSAVEVRWSETSKLRSGCSPTDVGSLMGRFLSSFNRGDEVELSKLFFGVGLQGIAPSEWYSVHEKDPSKNSFTAYDLKTLLPYLMERHRQMSG